MDQAVRTREQQQTNQPCRTETETCHQGFHTLPRKMTAICGECGRGQQANECDQVHQTLRQYCAQRQRQRDACVALQQVAPVQIAELCDADAVGERAGKVM